MILIQLIILAALLGWLLWTRPIRSWICSCERKDLLFGAAILGALVLGHALDFSRATFPLVNWSMYTEVNAEDDFQVVNVICHSDDGQQKSLNPIELYPSLCHCFPARFTALVKAADEGKLTENDTRIYDRLIQSMSTQYAARHGMSLKTTRVELVKIDSLSGATIERKLVSVHDARPASKNSVVSRSATHGNH